MPGKVHPNQDPPSPDGGSYAEDDLGEGEEEELIADNARGGKDIVDSRALQQSCMESLPSSVLEIRLWKNSLILSMAFGWSF